MTRRETPDRETSDGEVRAGPGDAGRQDRPETLPGRPGEAKRARQATRLLVGLIAVGLLVWVVLRLAG